MSRTLAAGEQPHRVGGAQPEAELRLGESEEASGRDRRAGRDGVEGVRVVRVLELQAADVHGVRADVGQLGEVTDRVAVGLDLVEPDGLDADRRAVVGRALGRDGLAEGARAVGAATVGGRRVRGPAVGVDQGRAVRHEHPRRVGAAEAEPARDVDVDREVAPGRDRGAGGDRERAGVVVVLQPQPRDVGRRGAVVAQLDPVDRRTAVGLDLVDLDAGQRVVRLGRSAEADERGAGEQDRDEDGQGRTTQGHRVPRWSAAESAVGEQP